eukprot:8761417-Heterocapsa_arctica.AAC.1
MHQRSAAKCHRPLPSDHPEPGAAPAARCSWPGSCCARCAARTCRGVRRRPRSPCRTRPRRGGAGAVPCECAP